MDLLSPRHSHVNAADKDLGEEKIQRSGKTFPLLSLHVALDLGCLVG